MANKSMTPDELRIAYLTQMHAALGMTAPIHPWASLSGPDQNFFMANAAEVNGTETPKWKDPEEFFNQVWATNFMRCWPIYSSWSKPDWGILTDKEKLGFTNFWNALCSYFGWYGFGATSGSSDDIEVGQVWQLKSSGHRLEVISISGDDVKLRYKQLHTEVELKKDDLKASAKKI